MAYLKIKLSENNKGECIFIFSSDISDTIRKSIKELLEIPYLQRREEKNGDRTTVYMKNVPENVRGIFQRGAMKIFIKQGGEINDN